MDRAFPGPHNAEVKRLVWAVALSAAAALVAALVMTITHRPTLSGTVQYLLTVPIPFLAAGAYLAWRRPDSRSGRLLVYGTALTMAYPALLEQGIVGRYEKVGAEGWMAWALIAEAMFSTVGLMCLAILIAFFPGGRPKTSAEQTFWRSLGLLPVLMLIGVISNEHVLVEPVAYGTFPPFENPIHLEAVGWMGRPTAAMRYLVNAVLVLALGSLVVRYRRENASERRQIRWVLFGSGSAVAIGVLPFFVQPLLGQAGNLHGSLALTLGTFALLLIPFTIIVAIEQPSWLDTDAVIRKSFAYGALSIGIFVMYAAIAAGMGLAAGTRLPLEAAIVVTAGTAFAFQPARRQLQRLTDRWFFGEQPTPIEAVADFDHTMGLPGSGSQLGAHLAETVRGAALLRWVSVDLPPEPTHTSGIRGEQEAHVTVIEHGNEHFGTIRCGPRFRGRFDQADADLVKALANQAALSLFNARLAARIVQAQEAERRRIERNIHDGAQQDLVALVANLGVARARIKQGSLQEEALIELQDTAAAILRDIRELAQGIHPTVLTDGGLIEAVEDRCSRLPMDVVVEASPGLRSRRFEDDVEGAAYFFVAEGLANVLKHADATRARVKLSRANGELELTVSDNGAGFDPEAAVGNGLAGLTDRFKALAGSVDVKTAPGQGTVLEGRIPVEGHT